MDSPRAIIPAEVSKQGVVAAYRLTLAALTVIAIGVQLVTVSSKPAFDPVNFFSFFTILSNVLGATVFAIGGVRRPRGQVFALFRGAAVVYLGITGVVYELLLSGDPAAVAVTLPWVNLVLHVLMPIAVVVDWLVDPPSTRLAPRVAAWWLAFPLAWVVYSLIRGPIANWYPYPFLDPGRAGVGAVVGYCAVIAVGFIVVIASVAWTGNRLRTV